MQKEMVCVMVVLVIGVSANHAYSQEINLATFQETAQVIIDKSISQNITASITLQSTSIQEIKIPAELEQRIREDGTVAAIIFTNQEQCVLGVENESCIIINALPNPENKGVLEIQNHTKNVAESYIDEINQALDTDARFHSIFIHTADESNRALNTSGIVSGRGAVSAVYTLPMEDTQSMYEKISSILIPKIIREKGGFYDVARGLSSEENAKMSFSIIPTGTKSLMQLKLSVDYPNTAQGVSEISPLEFLKVESIKRSDYFSSGFYPLNSIIQVVVLSPNETKVSDVRGEIISTRIINDEKIPTELEKDGWIFDPQEGELIQGKYIFGKETEIDKDRLKFSLGGKDTQLQREYIYDYIDESNIIVIIIAIVAISAAIWYLRGYAKK